MTSIISEELKELVSRSVKLLGTGIQEIYGVDLYHQIENLRKRMKSVRASESYVVEAALEKVYQELQGSESEDLHRIAKSFSLMLELINTCEAAYRSFRLKDSGYKHGKKPHSLVFVFTSHPTEARSQNFLLLMDKIESLLFSGLNSRFEDIEHELFYLLKIALRLDLANNRRPQVKDEAHQIFHEVLGRPILKEQISLRRKGVDVFFRTWVGGDKDGHPKVGYQTMLQSFALSRGKLLEFIVDALDSFGSDADLVDKTLLGDVKKIKTYLRTIRLLKPNDGRKILLFKKKIHSLLSKAAKNKLDSPDLRDIEELIWLYPALVLPLEIREDHELIHAAITNPRQPIAKMLSTLKSISAGMDSKWYVRGFVISMCQDATDILAAIKLTKKMTGSYSLPVVPLFENERGLTHSVKILDEAFKKFDFYSHHTKNWGGRLEVMLGYSDSSKENGVLPGRMMVEKALLDLEKFILKKKLTPVFFHGSGGSISRGGGSIREQIAWWPESALNIYKVTVQGETVQRHFHQPLIMRSQVEKIVEAFTNYRPHHFITPQSALSFAEEIQMSYRSLVGSDEFHELVSRATPYDFLNILKIGSRPTKRSGKGKFTIRAIPWILCWTQTRLLLPFWWGLGSAWEKMDETQKKELIQFHKNSPLMQTYMKNLGFTFAKIELGVWNFHIKHSQLSQEKKDQWRKKIVSELDKSIVCFKELSENKDFTWFRPMLGESIVFRSSMIHPLNVIQKLALERKDNVLLRETVTGIACGMLTTG